MNPQQKINDVTYLVRELNIELSKMIACLSRLEKTKDKLSKHYEELDCEEKEMVHSIFVEKQMFNEMDWEVRELIKDISDKKQKDEEYQMQRQARYNKYMLKRL